MPEARGRVPGDQDLQQVGFVVARLKAKGLYNILQRTMTQPEPSMSGGLPLPRGTGGCLLQWQRVNLRDYSPRYSLLNPFPSVLAHGHIWAT